MTEKFHWLKDGTSVAVTKLQQCKVTTVEYFENIHTESHYVT